MQLIDVPKEVLTHFYRTTFGVSGMFPIPDKAFAGCDFETYCALRSILYPDAAPRDHARSSSRFKHLVDGLPPNTTKKPKPLLWHGLRNKKSQDLAQCSIPDGVTSLLVDRCKALGGWAYLQKAGTLEELTVVLCSGEAEFSDSFSLKALTIKECNLALVQELIRAISAPRLELVHYATPVFDLSLIQGACLRELRITAPLVRGWDALETPNIETLTAYYPDQSFMSYLDRQEQIRRLDFDSHEPLPPEAMPAIVKKLERLAIPAWPQHKDAWIQWAADHPGVSCLFRHLETSALPAKIPRTRVASIHRGTSILELTKGKTIRYQLLEDMSTGDESNGDLEEMLIPLAKEAGKKIKWDSEADTLIAESKKQDDLYWVVDQILDSRA